MFHHPRHWFGIYVTKAIEGTTHQSNTWHKSTRSSCELGGKKIRFQVLQPQDLVFSFSSVLGEFSRLEKLVPYIPPKGKNLSKIIVIDSKVPMKGLDGICWLEGGKKNWHFSSSSDAVFWCDESSWHKPPPKPHLWCQRLRRGRHQPPRESTKIPRIQKWNVKV